MSWEFEAFAVDVENDTSERSIKCNNMQVGECGVITVLLMEGSTPFVRLVQYINALSFNSEPRNCHI
jgi:hypothetical protein